MRVRTRIAIAAISLFGIASSVPSMLPRGIAAELEQDKLLTIKCDGDPLKCWLTTFCREECMTGTCCVGA